ncbi:MAG: hypothetical protein ACXWDI_13415 [Nocardioides sp.]
MLGWVGRDYVVAVRHPASWTEATIDLLPVRVGQKRTVGVVECSWTRSPWPPT